MKRHSMAQWMNLHRNNSFINWTWLPLLCERFGAILLVLVGLMAVRQSDKIVVDFEIFKILYRSIASLRFSLHLSKVQCYYSVTTAF